MGLPGWNNKKVLFGRVCLFYSLTKYFSNKIQSVYHNMHDGKVLALSISSDGETLVTGGVDSIVSVWRLNRKFNADMVSSLILKSEKSEFCDFIFNKKANENSLSSSKSSSADGKYEFMTAFSGHQTAISALAISKSFE